MLPVAHSDESPLLMRRPSHPRSSASTPRSPFETGIPTLFHSPLAPLRRYKTSRKTPARPLELHVFLTLAMSTVGAGMLSVPYTFLLVPTWTALLSIVLVGFSMAITANNLLLAHVQLVEQEERRGSARAFASFQAIAVAAGGTALGYAVSIVTAIGIYGGCVGCVRIVHDIAPFLVVMVHRAAMGDQGRPLSSTTAQEIGGYVLWTVFSTLR